IRDLIVTGVQTCALPICIREARIRDPDEHNQREDDERDCVEEVEALERPEVMMGGRDDEARNRRAEAETEVACDSSERGRCGARSEERRVGKECGARRGG